MKKRQDGTLHVKETRSVLPWIVCVAMIAGILPYSALADEIPPVVQKALPRVEIQHVETLEMNPTVYIVTTSQGVLYLDGSGRYLFTGELYDLVAQENLTQAHSMGTERIRFDDLPLSAAILYKKGKHKVAVFADPDCPFCQKLHPELRDLDADVYVFLFPLTELHPLAYRKSVSAWCSEDRIAALNTVMSKQSLPFRNCEHPVDRTLTLAAKLGLRATPTVILEDGSVIEGYRPARELARLLEKKAP